MRPDNANMIDAASDTSTYADAIIAAGIAIVGRYYNQQNSKSLPSKCLTASEAQVLSSKGLNIIAVYQQAQNKVEDFTREKGQQAATYAYDCATRVGQPKDTVIYFSVDFDATADEIEESIKPFFQGVKETLQDYVVGTYGSGLVCNTLYDEQLCQRRWLSQSTGFYGTEQAIQEGKYEILQYYPPGEIPPTSSSATGVALNVDFNQYRDGGAFVVPAGQTNNTGKTYRVTASSGLNLRDAPDTSAEILASLVDGALVTEILDHQPMADGWLYVNTEFGEGYMYETYLSVVN